MLLSKMYWTKTIVVFCFLLGTVSCQGVTTKKNVGPRDASMSPTLKKEILSLMGLPRRPRPNMVTRLYGRRFSAPLYMMKLYNSISQNQSYHDGFCCNGTIADWRALGADTIMSYLNQVKGKRPKISRHHAIFKFKVESPEGEKVTATEFRLYKEVIPTNKQSWQNSTYVVRLYQIIYPAQVLDLLQTQVLRSWEKGWQAFDITKAGKVWLGNPAKNYGIELSIVNLYNEEVSPYRAGFVGFHGPREKRPFLVSFFRQDGSAQYSRRFYPEDMWQHRVSRVPRSLDSQIGGGGGGGGSARQGGSKLCQLRFLHVSFYKLRWQDWVIAPDGYTAFYCHGECSFPLNSNMNATNHAIVQTLVHLMNPKTVPKPCCAPTKLSPISVLYYDDSGNVVLKKYNNMVVKACGCH